MLHMEKKRWRIYVVFPRTGAVAVGVVEAPSREDASLEASFYVSEALGLDSFPIILARDRRWQG